MSVLLLLCVILYLQQYYSIHLCYILYKKVFPSRLEEECIQSNAVLVSLTQLRTSDVRQVERKRKCYDARVISYVLLYASRKNKKYYPKFDWRHKVQELVKYTWSSRKIKQGGIKASEGSSDRSPVEHLCHTCLGAGCHWFTLYRTVSSSRDVARRIRSNGNLINHGNTNSIMMYEELGRELNSFLVF